MKKVQIFLLAITALAFQSCKLPWASIQGATFMDYVPIGMIIYGVGGLIYTYLNETANKVAYENKTKNPAVKRFVFGWGAVVSLIFGLFWIFS